MRFATKASQNPFLDQSDIPSRLGYHPVGDMSVMSAKCHDWCAQENISTDLYECGSLEERGKKMRSDRNSIFSSIRLAPPIRAEAELQTFEADARAATFNNFIDLAKFHSTLYLIIIWYIILYWLDVDALHSDIRSSNAWLRIKSWQVPRERTRLFHRVIRKPR